MNAGKLGPEAIRAASRRKLSPEAVAEIEKLYERMQDRAKAAYHLEWELTVICEEFVADRCKEFER